MGQEARYKLQFNFIYFNQFQILKADVTMSFEEENSWPLGILHSAEWIWSKPDDEEEVSPEQVICARELGDVQLSFTFLVMLNFQTHFWTTSSVKWPPFQREVHSIVIISRQTWEDHQHCEGGVLLFFVWLTGSWELALFFRCSANDDACLVSYMMHEDGKRVSYEKWKWNLQLALLNKFCISGRFYTRQKCINTTEEAEWFNNNNEPQWFKDDGQCRYIFLSSRFIIRALNQT